MESGIAQNKIVFTPRGSGSRLDDTQEHVEAIELPYRKNTSTQQVNFLVSPNLVKTKNVELTADHNISIRKLLQSESEDPPELL